MNLELCVFEDKIPYEEVLEKYLDGEIEAVEFDYYIFSNYAEEYRSFLETKIELLME